MGSVQQREEAKARELKNSGLELGLLKLLGLEVRRTARATKPDYQCKGASCGASRPGHWKKRSKANLGTKLGRRSERRPLFVMAIFV